MLKQACRGAKRGHKQEEQETSPADGGSNQSCFAQVGIRIEPWMTEASGAVWPSSGGGMVGGDGRSKSPQ